MWFGERGANVSSVVVCDGALGLVRTRKNLNVLTDVEVKFIRRTVAHVKLKSYFRNRNSSRHSGC